MRNSPLPPSSVQLAAAGAQTLALECYLCQWLVSDALKLEHILLLEQVPGAPRDELGCGAAFRRLAAAAGVEKSPARAPSCAAQTATTCPGLVLRENRFPSVCGRSPVSTTSTQPVQRRRQISTACHTHTQCGSTGRRSSRSAATTGASSCPKCTQCPPEQRPTAGSGS